MSKLHYHIKGLMFYIRPYTFDIQCLEAVISDKLYEKENFEPKYGDTIIDLGSYIGDYALYARSKGARIIAFEPNKENFDLLIQNTTLNGMDIESYQIAVSDHIGEQTLYIKNSNAGESSLIYKQDKETTVHTVSLNAIFETYGVNTCSILRFDIQGAEFFIFDNFKYFQQVDRIVGKVHSPEHEEKITKLFKKEGFDISIKPCGSVNIVFAKKND